MGIFGGLGEKDWGAVTSETRKVFDWNYNILYNLNIINVI